MEYIAYLHKNRDSDYGVSFPDSPGCITAGKTLDEASRLAPEALALHIAGMIEDGDAVPEPSKLDDVACRGGRGEARSGGVHGERGRSGRNGAREHHGTGKPDRENRRAGGSGGPDAVGVHGALGHRR
jgi:predicted RNase H-like HicB family nuclease